MSEQSNYAICGETESYQTALRPSNTLKASDLTAQQKTTKSNQKKKSKSLPSKPKHKSNGRSLNFQARSEPQHTKTLLNPEAKRDNSFEDNMHLHLNTTSYQSGSYPLDYFENDRTHSNPEYKYSYTNALCYRYGYPTTAAERADFEQEFVYEAVEKAQRALRTFED